MSRPNKPAIELLGNRFIRPGELPEATERAFEVIAQAARAEMRERIAASIGDDTDPDLIIRDVLGHIRSIPTESGK